MRARDLGRALVVRLARLLLPARRGGDGVPRKVLVIRTDERVGNVLLTIPLLRALRRGLPDAELVFLHAASKASLVRGLPYADRLVPFEKKALFRRPWRFFALLAALRRERFDVAIEAGHYHAFSLTAALLARAVGAARSIGHDRGDARALLDVVVPPPPGVVHDVSVKLSLLAPLGVPPAGLELETPLAADPASRAEGRALLAAAGLAGERVLVVNPGARKADRRWAPERYAAAAGRLAARFGLAPLVIWGPGEEELARAVVAGAGPRARLAPPTDLRQLAALLREAALVLTNDTGPMHLAVAAGAPTVAVFLVGDHERWGHPLPGFAAVPLAACGGDPAREGDAIERAAERVLAAVAGAA
jgi:ADP-heptose:LPS heptosyltransferase